MPKRSSFWWTAARRLVASAVGPLLLISGFLALEAAGALPRCNCGWCFGVALGYARSLTPHRPAGLESRAISALRAISSAQSLFREGHKDRVRGYGSLAQLGTAVLVDRPGRFPRDPPVVPPPTGKKRIFFKKVKLS